MIGSGDDVDRTALNPNRVDQPFDEIGVEGLMEKPKWIVDVKGGPHPSGGHEISAVMSNNRHGIASYGWPGTDKIIIASSGGPCHDVVSPYVFSRLISIAVDVVYRLNAGEEA